MSLFTNESHVEKRSMEEILLAKVLENQTKLAEMLVFVMQTIDLRTGNSSQQVHDAKALQDIFYRAIKYE